MKGVKENNNNNSLLTWIVMTGNGWFLLYSLWGHKVGLFKCELFFGGLRRRFLGGFLGLLIGFHCLYSRECRGKERRGEKTGGQGID